jgi:hypothetical protein
MLTYEKNSANIKPMQEILKTYPKSEAAKQARKMLGQPQVNFEADARVYLEDPIWIEK